MGNQKLYKGSLQTIILKLLETNDKMYGYEITQHVKALTNGELKITEGALYPALHKLEAEGLLAVCIQHEMDHLLGKVFVEYLSPLKRNRIKTKMKKRAKDYFEKT